MVNRWIGIGRVGQDLPTLAHTPAGVPYCTFQLATDRPKRKDGGDPAPDWTPIKAWRQDAEFAAEHIRTGDLVCIEGRLEISSFTGQDGQPRKKAEIVAFTSGVTKLASKGGGPGGRPSGGPASPDPAPVDFEAEATDSSPFDDID